MMEKLPSVRDFLFVNKTILLRTNYDVPLKEGRVADTSRIDESLSTLNYLLEQKAKVVILSHLGRPEGQVKPELSLKPVINYLSMILKKEIPLSSDLLRRVYQGIIMLENLRFWPGEENNDQTFVQQLASLGDFYVNDAFACSHRPHASIVGLPKILPSAFGLDFLKEVEILSRLRENPKRPVTVILGGAKEDKLEVLEQLLDWADNILVGGKLPQFIKQPYPDKVLVAQLNNEGKDITLESVNQFKEIIKQSGTVLWAGPMGIFEEPENEEGTKQIAQVVSESQAFKTIGGGDTEAALTKFDLEKNIDYISSGGGAMFEFLAKGTLPGIETIIKHD